MRKSKSWAPSRTVEACAADAAEGREGCCCDADTPGAGDSCAVNDNKLSCSVANIQIKRGFIGLMRIRSATAGKSELRFHFILHNSSFSLSVRRPRRSSLAKTFGVGSSDWLDLHVTNTTISVRDAASI